MNELFGIEALDPTRTTTGPVEEYDIDSGASEVQRGYFKTPQFYGDNKLTPQFTAFSNAVQTAASWAGAVDILRRDLADERREGDVFRLTKKEFAELEKKAKSISSYGNIPESVAQDFLIILCYMDNVKDLETVADAVQIPELADATIIRKPLVILAIPNLEKVAFCASAVEGLVNMFKRFLPASQAVPPSSGESTSSILDNLGKIIGGISNAASIAMRLEQGDAANALGNFLSELITGNRIPMSVIAKNPNLQSPSYVGKAFFGEAPSALSLIDINELFNKRIGVFPVPSNGAGTTSFGIQNFKSFQNAMTVAEFVSKISTGSKDFDPGSKKERMIMGMVDKVSDITGARADEIIDIRYADTSIPMLAALSAVDAGGKQSPFGVDTYSGGWKLSNSVGNHLQLTQPSFMTAVKRYF